MPIRAEKHRFTRKNVDLTPEQPGVYALYADDGVAYYGAARPGDTLRSRLAAHLQGQQEPGRGAAKLFNFEVTLFPMSRESALLEEHRRAKWRLPPYNDML